MNAPQDIAESCQRLIAEDVALKGAGVVITPVFETATNPVSRGVTAAGINSPMSIGVKTPRPTWGMLFLTRLEKSCLKPTLGKHAVKTLAGISSTSADTNA